MNKIYLKRFLVIVLFFLLIICSFYYVSNASEEMKAVFNEIDNADDTTRTSEEVQNVIGTILVAVQVVAMAVAFVILLVLAMKYMAAAPGEKADIKKSFFVYVVGAIVVFGAIGILRVIEALSHAFN